MLTFEIPGAPIPLSRHRTCGKRTYDPSKEAKKNFAWKVREIVGPIRPLSGALRIIVDFYMPIPQSLSDKKRKSLDGRVHIKKPDQSNLIKFVEDALNEVIWKDDSLIAESHLRKIYSFDPKTVIHIEEIEQGRKG